MRNFSIQGISFNFPLLFNGHLSTQDQFLLRTARFLFGNVIVMVCVYADRFVFSHALHVTLALTAIKQTSTFPQTYPVFSGGLWFLYVHLP